MNMPRTNAQPLAQRLNFFSCSVLNSAEHEIKTAHEFWYSQNGWNFKVSKINFMLSWVDHEKRFITPRPDEFWPFAEIFALSAFD